MTNGDPEGRIFLSHPHTIRIMDSLSCSPLNTSFNIGKTMKKTSRKSWIRWDASPCRNFNVTMTSRIDVRTAHGRRTAVRFFIFPTGWYGIEVSHMGKNNGNPDLVCEKFRCHTYIPYRYVPCRATKCSIHKGSILWLYSALTRPMQCQLTKRPYSSRSLYSRYQEYSISL